MIPVPFLVGPVVGCIYSIYRLRKENKALANGNRILYSALKTRSAQLHYLAGLLDEHGIEIDEFDQIVLTQEF